MNEEFRVSGIEIRLTPEGKVWAGDLYLGRVFREARAGQFFWRAFDPEEEPIKRFLTARHEAIQVLILRADLVEGIGF